MTISDRIQNMRKLKGISQEELADRLGVSRQAVSKWESEQSAPDLDRVIAMSELFEVTTDYILKGIEPPEQANEKRPEAGVFVIAATVLDFIGLVVSAAVWYERQTAAALAIGLVFMALGCMVFGVGALNREPRGKERAKLGFWTVNIWLLSFIPLSFIYNVLFSRMAAPYPLLASPIISYPAFWLVYIAICAGVTASCVSKIRRMG